MNNTNKNIVFHPIISSIQKVALYETKTRIYLVGSNIRETRFRVLAIDRTLKDQLRIEEDPNEISAKEIRKFVNCLGPSKLTSAYGVIGFVRFLEGYYLVLVTKRTPCAFIGKHFIYTIKETVMVRVNEVQSKPPHPNEQRYVRMFQNIDLRSNFYFSYSYDLTRTLQHNLSAPSYVGVNIDIDNDEPLPDWGSLTNNVASQNERVDYAFRSNPRKRFIWNQFLLEPMKDIMLKDWRLEIIHGFVNQSNINIFGRPVYVCLIARRSTRFAGTRFLKRGANFQGDVANEVETEQIVTEGNRLCSFTQMRGSIPAHWSQDVSKMVPKPQISLNMSDPFAETAARHFENILFHFGAPLVILNLVKKREKRKHESILEKEFRDAVKYLNIFLYPQHRIRYIHFDMARKNRGSVNVMDSLAKISEDIIKLTGMFFQDQTKTTFQTGIVRVNCVDCLDRTNTAQFAIGKCVLAHQLHNLGVLQPPKLEFDSDCVTMLEQLYEDHGDTLALQYGGSQLVHRIKTYRKTAAWASQGNDIMQTLSRYYSNTFSDTEKQHSINLFLGLYIPSRDDVKRKQSSEDSRSAFGRFLDSSLMNFAAYPPIWELQSDYQLHNPPPMNNPERRSLTDWLNHTTRWTLPDSCSDSNKIVSELIRVHSKEVEMIDSYSIFNSAFKLSTFEEHIAYEISRLAKSLLPTNRTNFSPFHPGRRRNNQMKNPSLTGKSSIGSSNSSTSSSGDCGSSTDEELSNEANLSTTASQTRNSFSFEALLPKMEDVYGTKITSPSPPNQAQYKRFAQIGKIAAPPITDISRPMVYKSLRSMKFLAISDFPNDSFESVRPPKVDPKSIEIYKSYIDTPNRVVVETSSKTADMLENYINFIECNTFK